MALGPTLTVYVNGIPALAAQDVPLSGGRIGLGVWAHSLVPYRATFDNLSISLPDY